MTQAPRPNPIPRAARGLGKGLSALMADSYSQSLNDASLSDAADEAGRADNRLQTLHVTQVQSGKYQPRDHFDETALAELTESVQKYGIMQPILVRELQEGQYEIIAGERRWRAAKRAGLAEIPVLIRNINHQETLELALIENIQRQDLNPLEEAAGYQQLLQEFHYTQEQLSHIVHKSRSHVANLLRLLSLPVGLQEMLRDNRLSMGHARALMSAEHPQDLAEKIVAGGWSVRETEACIRREKDGPGEPRQAKPRTAKARPESETKDNDIFALEATLSENLGLKVSIQNQGNAGAITLCYDSLEQLDEILRRLGGSI